MREVRERAPAAAVGARRWYRPEHFGAHSFGATALFAAGADPNIIRTISRSSSVCYRQYVRAGFGQTLEWTQRSGSTVVDDVAGEFEEVDCY